MASRYILAVLMFLSFMGVSFAGTYVHSYSGGYCDKVEISTIHGLFIPGRGEMDFICSGIQQPRELHTTCQIQPGCNCLVCESTSLDVGYARIAEETSFEKIEKELELMYRSRFITIQ